MQIFANFLSQFEIWAQRVPVEIFTFFGAFLEEVIAPVPSPLVMTLSGSVAAAQNKLLLFLLVLSIIGATGKTIGSVLLYLITDKAEDFVFKRFGRFFGVKHKDIEAIGKHFNGGIRDDIALFLIRCTPIIPSAPVSIVSGFIKINLRTFITMTFLGSIIRDMFYLYFGYAGVGSFEAIMSGLDTLESVMTVLMGVGIFGVVVWFYMIRKKREKKSLEEES